MAGISDKIIKTNRKRKIKSSGIKITLGAGARRGKG
jgi:hypothetical protein